jgi:hypothetical protein
MGSPYSSRGLGVMHIEGGPYSSHVVRELASATRRFMTWFIPKEKVILMEARYA